MKHNILVVDDSALMRRTFCDIINSDSRYEAKDYCRDGQEALERLRVKSYDAVVLDFNMPRMNGDELLAALNRENIKANVLMVSAETKEGAAVTLRCMELGAIDFVTKPENIVEARGSVFKKTLISVLDAVFETKAHRDTPKVSVSTPRKNRVVSKSSGKSKLIALACSTGGPRSLQSVIPFIDPRIDAPMVLVQHMPKGFTKTLADRLNELSKVEVKEAEEGDVLVKGHVYIAPGGKHLTVYTDRTGAGRIRLSDAPPVGTLKPCADIMYDSIMDTAYDDITCVVLTGMGQDGTRGIADLDGCKNVYCISQDAASCIVYGMPKSVADAGLSDEIVPLNKVAEAINKKVGVK